MKTNQEHKPFDTKELVYTIRDRATQGFDQSHSELLEDVIGDVGSLHFMMLYCTLKGNTLLPDPQFQAFALIAKSFDFIISALRMTRERALLESYSLMRTALESACVAFQICEDPRQLESYLGRNIETRNQYSATRAVSFTSKHVPRIGEVYGALSKAGVHANVRVFGPRVEVTEDGNSVAMVITLWGRDQNTEGESMALVLIQLCNRMILRIAELVLTEPISGRDWRRIRGTTTEYFGATEKQIEKIYNEFIRMANERKRREQLS